MKYIHTIITILAALLPMTEMLAFPSGTYAASSVLADGHWVKVAVEEDGLYVLTPSRLRSWGFSDPSKVVVRGYGGRRLSDQLSAENYIDDLPVVQTRQLADGSIVFFGTGAGEWEEGFQSGYFNYRQNDYSNAGHYFVGELGEGEQQRAIPGVAEPYSGINAVDYFMERVQHERELVATPGGAGPMLLGEDFRYTRQQTFDIPLEDAVGGSAAWLQYSFVCNTRETSVSVAISAEGTNLSGKSPLRPTTTDHTYGSVGVFYHNFNLAENPGKKLSVKMSLQCSSTPASANLNYIAVNYRRNLALPSTGYLLFNSSAARLSLNAGSGTPVIWDVTDPRNIYEVQYGKEGTQAVWAYPNVARRCFVAANDGAKLPEPAYVGAVANQNLHGLSCADMVIVSPQTYMSDSRRLAEFHANSIDSMTVHVVTPEQIYNEFSSGTLDAGALRRFFKMLYDRGNAEGKPLRYAILMGRITLDNRRLTATAPKFATVPSWMSIGEAASVSDNLGYCSDDYLAMLEDDSGINVGTDKLSIAIGRIPVTDETESRDIVDKMLEYAAGKRRTAWKQRIMYLADDQNQGVHLRDSESAIARLGDQNPYFVNKVYMDAYELQGSIYPEARKQMFRYLDEGVVWWNFIGHASPTGWTHEHQLSYTDLNNMYLRHWPFIYAATCDFVRLDGSDISGGEILFKERNGGCIGIISAIRPVYISNNSYLSLAMGRAMAQRDDKGMILPPGEMYRRAKNDLRAMDPVSKVEKPVSDTNRLRYMFVGNPALRLAMPSNYVTVDSINGEPVNIEEPPSLAALQQGSVSGRVTGPDGRLLEDFNGIVSVDIFDAEHTVTTKGNGDDGVVLNFEDHGERVYTGSATVKNGRYTLKVAMPMELSQNYRPATMSLFAYDTETDEEAVGVNRDFYVYGLDETVENDVISPTIETLVLNHEDFRNGDTVNKSPMLIASVSDNVGINVSNAGVGHQLTAVIDGRDTYSDLSNYYTPASDGSPRGTINYPFDNLKAGQHKLSFRVWDTAGNYSEEAIDFVVSESLAPRIYDVYTDANPASTEANFYLRHNQPDNTVTVTITVYNLLGKPLWSNTVTGRSDMFLTMPVTWNLCDASGRRVGRGIYLYRASITSDGQSFETASRRLAVTAR